MFSRILQLADRPSTLIPVHVSIPVEDGMDWSCSCSIGWPEGLWERHTIGIDAIQAIELALRMVGTELYASNQHRSGQLMWLERGAGYGFPVPAVIKDQLIGEDRSL